MRRRGRTKTKKKWKLEIQKLKPKTGSFSEPRFGGQRTLTQPFVSVRCPPKRGSENEPVFGFRKGFRKRIFFQLQSLAKSLNFIHFVQMQFAVSKHISAPLPPPFTGAGSLQSRATLASTCCSPALVDRGLVVWERLQHLCAHVSVPGAGHGSRRFSAKQPSTSGNSGGGSSGW